VGTNIPRKKAAVTTLLGLSFVATTPLYGDMFSIAKPNNEHLDAVYLGFSLALRISIHSIVSVNEN
jgi:hypothetical protein